MNSTPRTRIHKNAVKAWAVTSGIFGLLWFSPPAIYVITKINLSYLPAGQRMDDMDWYLLSILIAISLTLYLFTALLLPKIRWKRWRYDVSEQEIDMQRGIIVTKRTLVPINRIQHVDTRQGPVYRKFGLSSVTISTAATTHEIPALDEPTADELRHIISTLVRKVKDDV